MSGVWAAQRSPPAKGIGWRASTGTASSSGWREEDGELKILGAGLASSFGEAHFSLESDAGRAAAVLGGKAVNTPYRHDAFQPRYLVSEFAGRDRRRRSWRSIPEELLAL